MFDPISVLEDGHDRFLMIAAIAVCLFGSYTLFSFIDHALATRTRTRVLWLTGAGLACGGTVWATHFIAMLALSDTMPLGYETAPTIASIIISVFGGMLALLVANVLSGIVSRVAGGLIIGMTIVTMHQVGMQALAMPHDMGDPKHVLLVMAVGTFLAIASLVTFEAGSRARHILAALLLSLSVATIHFGCVASMPMSKGMVHGAAHTPAEHDLLSLGVVVVVALLLMLALLAERFAVGLSRNEKAEAARIRSLADITLEGIAVVDDDGHIVDANEQMKAFCLGATPALLSDVLPHAAALLATRSETSMSVEEDMLRTDAPTLPVKAIVQRSTHLRQPAWVVVVRDLTERREAESRILHVANHDALTGLPNRTLFMDRLTQSLARTSRTDERTALLYVDLDGFKAINDVYGHAKGDEVLQTVSGIMAETVRAGDTLARLGGDEFAIVQNDAEQPEGARILAARLIDAIEAVYGGGKSDVTVGASIGIAISPDDADEPEMLVRNADTALYRAKDAGRGTWRFFEAAMDEAQRERRSLEMDLRKALGAGELWVSYQPQMNAATNEVSGFEALVRWDHPTLGPIGPDVFIPLAEQSGYIVTLGTWVLDTACRDAALWDPSLHVAVNLSPVQIHQGGLVRRVEKALAMSGLDARRLELEITETALLKDRTATIVTLQRLKQMGIRIAMDDFGTGYSSLSNLQSFPFDKIKVDRSFIASIEHDPKASSIVKAIISLGHSLNLPIIAEGVENKGQLDLLRAELCTEIQGYLVGRPQRIEMFEEITRNRDLSKSAAA